MLRLPAVFLTVVALTGAASAVEITVCSSQRGTRLISYAGGVEGFRPNENFIREWVRESGTPIIGAPQHYDIQRFNGDDAALTYDYAIDGRRVELGAPQDDKVHIPDGRTEIGAKAYIQTYWDNDVKTLMAHILCNDTIRPEGDCRIGFEDARRLGAGNANGPVVTLFLDAATPSNICAGMASGRGRWWVVLDGVKSDVVEGACGGPELAKAFTTAGSATAVMISTYDYNKGEEVTNALKGSDITAAVALANHVRTLNYEPSPEQTAWLEALVAASKAAFGAAGDNLRPCTVQEPPT